jgi:hypothetical protein
MSTGFGRRDSGFGKSGRSRYACVPRKPMAFAFSPAAIHISFE